MGASHLSGPLTSTAGFVGAVTGNIVGNVTGDLTGNSAGVHTGGVVSSSVNIGSGGAITFAKKAAVSVDLPSLAAGELAEVSVTLAGAAAGDAVIANPPATVDANIMFCGAYVSAANTIKLRVRNNHATDAKDEAAANWVFVLIR
jgi:hypothetical protein